MTVLSSGELVSLSNTADGPSGVYLVDQVLWLYLPFLLILGVYNAWEQSLLSKESQDQ